MTDYQVIVLVCVLGVVGEGLRVVRPGQVLLGSGLLGRYGRGAAPNLFPGRHGDIHLSPPLPTGPTVRLSERRPAGVSSAAEHLDAERARKLIEPALAATNFVLVQAQLLAMHLLVLTPLVLLSGVVPGGWITLGISLGAILLSLVPAFVWAHRRVHPGRRGKRIQHAVMMVGFPPAGVYAADHIFDDAALGVHPLAAAAVLCRPEESHRMAVEYFRCWTYPREDEDAAEAAACLAAVRPLLDDQGWDLDAMLAPPSDAYGEGVVYCPRCLAMYHAAPGACRDCPGVATVSPE